MLKKITYKFQAPNGNLAFVRFNKGANNLPKSGIASVRAFKEDYAFKWAVPVSEIKVTRITE